MRRNTLMGELSAEVLGTFTLIIFGVGVVAQTVLTPFSAGAQSIHWAWGLGVVMGVYVAGGISGAHLNPAVTLGLALRRGFPWGKTLPYMGAQVVGAFLAAMVVRWNFYEAFNKFDPAKGFKSQVVFNTYPNNASGDMPDISQLGDRWQSLLLADCSCCLFNSTASGVYSAFRPPCTAVRGRPGQGLQPEPRVPAGEGSHGGPVGGARPDARHHGMREARSRMVAEGR